MKKSYIFAILAFVFIAITAVADTTYVCEDVGDWDMWNVPYAKQKELVGENVQMIVSVIDTAQQQRTTITANNGSGNMGLCYDGPEVVCSKVCTSGMVASGKCPCQYCNLIGFTSEIEQFINDLVDLILSSY